MKLVAARKRPRMRDETVKSAGDASFSPTVRPTPEKPGVEIRSDCGLPPISCRFLAGPVGRSAGRAGGAADDPAVMTRSESGPRAACTSPSAEHACVHGAVLMSHGAAPREKRSRSGRIRR